MMGRPKKPITEKQYVKRKEAMKYFKYDCADCGKFAIHLHHIDGDRTNNKLENLKTLCFDCHNKIHPLNHGLCGRPYEDL